MKIFTWYKHETISNEKCMTETKTDEEEYNEFFNLLKTKFAFGQIFFSFMNLQF